MLDKEITDLLAYAQTHLMLDALDFSGAARRVCDLLKLDGFVPVEYDTGDGIGEPMPDFESMTSPDKVLSPLLADAVSRGVCTEENKAALKAQLMDAVMLKPSEINDLFFDTYSVNPQKSFDFLYDYSVKDGYVDLAECAKNDRWEAKELKSKLEVIINLMPHAVSSGYPECALCYETTGLGCDANKRAVVFDLDGEDWFFTYSRHQYFDRHGVLVNRKHVAPTEGKDMLVKLAKAADFIGADGFVGTNATGVNGGAHNTSHEHFQTGFRTPPELKAGFKMRLKSKEYPYLEMGVVDWYNTVIRFSHSNLEKTVEFADKLITAWKGYSDAKIANTDGKHNFANVVARKVAGKYCFDVILRSDAVKKPRLSAEYDEIKASALALTDLLGYFVLPNKLSGELKQVGLYLDGTLPYNNAELPAEIKPFSKMIERMLKEQGGTVSKLEAKLNLHDEIDIACEKILSAAAVFDGESIKPFLESLDIAIQD